MVVTAGCPREWGVPVAAGRLLIYTMHAVLRKAIWKEVDDAAWRGGDEDKRRERCWPSSGGGGGGGERGAERVPDE